jgi:hypothetical protein
MNPKPTYYIYLDEKVQGPYSKDELKARLDSGILQADVQICTDGNSEWVRLSDTLPEILPTPSLPIAPSIEESSAPTQKYEGINRLGFSLSLVGIAVLGLALSTNPDVALYLPLITVGLGIIPCALRFKNIGRHPAWAFL